MPPKLPTLRWPPSHLLRAYATKAKPHSQNKKPTKKNPNSTTSSTKPQYTLPKTQPKIPITQEPHLQYVLPDGRQLGYSIYGPSLIYKHIPTLLLFHGFPGSRHDCRALYGASPHSDIRIIGIDRPGIGLSSWQRNRKVLDWPQDVLRLMDGLRIEKFSVLGASLGSPYALACASALRGSGKIGAAGGRLKRVGVLAGLAPVMESGISTLTPKEYFLGQNPWLLRILTWWSVGRFVPAHRDQSVWYHVARQLGFDGNHDQLQYMMASLKEPYRQGVKGNVYDACLVQRHWGFDVSGIEGEVGLWYGDRDENTPLEMGRWLERVIPGGKLRIFEGLNHSDMSDKAEVVVREMMEIG